MVALISCGVKKELPSNSALQHSLSQSLEPLPHVTVHLAGPTIGSHAAMLCTCYGQT